MTTKYLGEIAIMSTYRDKILQDDGSVKYRENDNGIFKTLEEVYAELRDRAKESVHQNCKTASSSQLELTEEVYRIIDDIQSYWSQFGFMDRPYNINLVVGNVTKYAQITKRVEKHDDDCINGDAFNEELDDIYMQK